MGFQPDQQEVGHCLERWNRIKKVKIWHKFCWVSLQQTQGVALLHKGERHKTSSAAVVTDVCSNSDAHCRTTRTVTSS